MIAIIAGGGGVEIVIATTGAGIEEIGMTAAEIAMTVGVTRIGTTDTIGADLDAALVRRPVTGSPLGAGPKGLMAKGARCLPNYLRAVFLS
jgi:hypothetical protein